MSRTTRAPTGRSTVAPTSTRSKKRSRLPALRAFTSGCSATALATVAITNPVHDTVGCSVRIRSAAVVTSSSTRACTWNRRLAPVEPVQDRLALLGDRAGARSRSSGSRPRHSSRSHERGSSTTSDVVSNRMVARRPRSYAGPARVTGAGEGDPGGVHRVGQGLRRVVAEQGAEQRRVGLRVSKTNGTSSAWTAPSPGDGQANSYMYVPDRTARAAWALGQANGRDPHPPVGLHRREQVPGAGAGVALPGRRPAPVSGASP